MPLAGVIILVEWALITLGGAAFLLVHGPPWKAKDRAMAWHVAALTAVAAVEPLGLLLVRVSLWPSLIIYTASVAVMYWRIYLLIQTRRRRVP